MTKKLRITVEGKAYDVTVDVLDSSAPASVAAPAPVAAAPAAAPAPAPAPKPAAPKAPAPAGAGNAVISPIAGKITAINVKVGDEVKVEQDVIVLEAMKMQTNVPTSIAGKVTAVLVNVGDAVEEGQALVTVA